MDNTCIHTLIEYSRLIYNKSISDTILHHHHNNYYNTNCIIIIIIVPTLIHTVTTFPPSLNVKFRGIMNRMSSIPVRPSLGV